MSAPVDVLAVMDRDCDECYRNLRRLDAEVVTGNVSGYAQEYADLQRLYREATDARVAVANLIAAANAVLGNTPPAGQPGHVDFGSAIVMLQEAVSRIGGGA